MKLPFLRDEAKETLEKIKSADIVVGIPSYNSESTIENVARTVAEGLDRYFPSLKGVFFLADGGSTDDTREKVAGLGLGRTQKVITIYRGSPGKGSAVRATLGAVALLKAKVGVTLDADLRSIKPEWIKLMGEPILKDKCDFVAPLYLRHKFDATITNDIAYPLTRSLYGVRIKQPIGGDFAFSNILAKDLLSEDVWHTEVARFGVDIFITTTALAKGYRSGEAALGVKIHNPKDPIELTPMLREVVGTLFSLAGKYYERWSKIKGSVLPRIPGKLEFVEPQEVKVNLEDLRMGFRAGWERFYSLWTDILEKETLEGLTRVKEEEESLSPTLWARILYDYLVAYQVPISPIDKHKLLWSLVPLYRMRTASFIEETQKMSNQEAEGVIEAQAEIFEDLKPYLIKRWSSELESPGKY